MTNYDNIPAEICERGQFVNFNIVHKKGQAKPTKVPYNSATGFEASSIDTSTWSTFEVACSTEGYAGIGYVFSPYDPYTGIDLDSCVVDGVIEPTAFAIVKQFDSYAEFSPSKTGIHIFVRAVMPEGKGRKNTKRGIEMYDRGRFFTITGDHVDGTPTVVNERQAELDDLYAQLFPKKESSSAPQQPVAEITADDHELFQVMLNSRNGARIQRLLNGDCSDYRGKDGKPDHSGADQALCNHLAFYTGNDKSRMDRMFRQSKLFREKWNRKDYRDSTIDKAVADNREVYRGKGRMASAQASTNNQTQTHDNAMPENEPPWMASDHELENYQGETPVNAAGKKPQSTVVYELARSAMNVFTSLGGESYAVITVDEHWETHPLRSIGVRNYLSYLFYHQEGKLPGSQAKQDAISLLEFDATKTRREVYTRIAQHDGKIYLDLCNPKWEAAEIDSDGWRIVPQPPVAFRRAKGMEEIPYPTAGGDVELLQSFINIEAQDWPLVAAWVMAALYPVGPYPILLLTGEQGSTKSTGARVLKELIDPNTAKLRGQPEDVRDLIIAAQNSRVLAYDNITNVTSDISDALCRIATGGGYTTRSLYTDTDEVVISVQRPVILTGISDFVTRPDLMDRAIPINMPAMTDTKRRDEATFWRDFEAARTTLLGAFLDAMVWAIAALPQTNLERMPRMADFARLAVAAEPALGLKPGQFLSRYAENRSEGAATLLDSSSIVTLIRKLVLINGEWSGGSAELLEAIEKDATDREKASNQWPKSPHKLTSELKRLAPVLRQLGIVDATHGHTMKGAKWMIKRLANSVQA